MAAGWKTLKLRILFWKLNCYLSLLNFYIRNFESYCLPANDCSLLSLKISSAYAFPVGKMTPKKPGLILLIAEKIYSHIAQSSPLRSKNFAFELIIYLLGSMFGHGSVALSQDLNCLQGRIKILEENPPASGRKIAKLLISITCLKSLENDSHSTSMPNFYLLDKKIREG